MVVYSRFLAVLVLVVLFMPANFVAAQLRSTNFHIDVRSLGSESVSLATSSNFSTESDVTTVILGEQNAEDSGSRGGRVLSVTETATTTDSDDAEEDIVVVNTDAPEDDGFVELYVTEPTEPTAIDTVPATPARPVGTPFNTVPDSVRPDSEAYDTEPDQVVTSTTACCTETCWTALALCWYWWVLMSFSSLLGLLILRRIRLR